MNYFALRHPLPTWMAYTTLNQVENLQIYKEGWKLNLSLLICRKNKVKRVRKDGKRIRVVGGDGKSVHRNGSCKS
jgi:hypothetical protein